MKNCDRETIHALGSAWFVANETEKSVSLQKTSMDKIEQQLDSIRGTEDFLKEIQKINIKAIVDKLTNSLDLFYCKTKGSKNMGTDLDKKRLIFTFEEIVSSFWKRLQSRYIFLLPTSLKFKSV